MCGILGAFSGQGAPPPTAQIAELVELLHHRGPDDRGVASLDVAVFGHTRLSIIGVERAEAQQPIKHQRCLLSFNGEIYNFRELSDDLRADGIALSGHSDTETLFYCLVHWGVAKTLDRLDGMFAFAFYDGRSRTLSLARDPVGEKPLYWSLARERVWFASEIKVLLASGEVSPAPNLRRIDDYLYTTKVNGAETLFRDVVELEPGTFLTLEDGQIEPRCRPYCRLEDGFEAAAAAEAWSPERFAERLGRAVSSRRISDVPVGILLSGGIDSNALTELMLESRPQERLDLFFADNENEAVSERPDAEAFLENARQRYPQARLDYHPKVQNFGDYIERLKRLTWFYDEPIQFQNSPLLGGLCEAARERGIKVLFSGEGSDELLHGYVRFARTAAQLEGIDDPAARLHHLYYGGGSETVDVIARLTAGVAEGAQATQPWNWLERHLDQPLAALQMIFSQKFRMQTLLQRQDRIGMASSIEIRVPFLAPGFVQWMNRMPLQSKFSAATGETKVALRALMRGRLPERILSKAKDGFPSDMAVWLRQPHMQAAVRELVGDTRGFCQSQLDGKLANGIVEDHFSGRQRRDMLIWQLFALEIWQRACVDTVKPVTNRPAQSRQSVATP
jgi:asparagine synthase (glutamine-hydrolysing)